MTKKFKSCNCRKSEMSPANEGTKTKEKKVEIKTKNKIAD
jgi:hypothetical protein